MQVKISSDETHIAIANSKGLVVILENFFNDFIVRPSVQNEHEENTVTTLNWHGNELFSGDNTGKVSVFSLVICSIFLFLNYHNYDFTILHQMATIKCYLLFRNCEEKLLTDY